MPDANPKNPALPELMATLRASIGPEILDAANPEQTLQQRATVIGDAGSERTLIGQAPTLVGLRPTIVMPGRPVVGESLDDSTLKRDVINAPITELSFSYGNESLSRWTEFTVHSVVGKGGMGEIFLAGQNALRREVAIKKIIPERLTKGNASETEASFVSEALVTGFLAHPNIVPIYSLGRDESGKWFFSMKMVRGIEWRHLLHPDRCKTPGAKAIALARNLDVGDPVRRAKHLDDNLRILLAICNAVAFAHSKMIIHRDLKPENVMVGEFGEVLVMDWGLAIDVAKAPPPPGTLDRRVLHRTEASMGGTPSYMSPEQFDFDENRQYKGAGLDRWTDVFLLGGMLYEIVTGSPPYVANSLNEVFMKIVECAPPVLPDTVPSELVSICQKAMAKNPTERYVDALEFQHALQNFLKHREAAVIAAKAEKESMVRAIPNLARAAVLYDQALELWPDNARYKEAREVTRAILAALESRARLMRFGLIAAVACIVIGLSVGFLLIQAQEKKTEEALKQQTLLSFEAVVDNAAEDDDYERVIRELDPYLLNSELTSSKKFQIAQQLHQSAIAFVGENREMAYAAKRGAKSIQIHLVHNISIELLRIPEGKFKMGSPTSEADRAPDESPQHEVSLSSFYMGKFDVTQQQYETVTGFNPSAYRGPLNPVDSVSWVEAEDFCKKLNKRFGSIGVHVQLPTEAQWEYACRAGTTTRFYFGDNSDDLRKYAWYKVNSSDTVDHYGTSPVGMKPPNAFGLFDMHGNVFEWCHDWYDSKYYSKSPEHDPLGPAEGVYDPQLKGMGHVLRGGSWDFDAHECRSANRDFKQESYRSYRRGFRIVMTAVPVK